MEKTAKTTLVKVKRHYQITIPDILRKKYSLSEGDFMEIEDKGSMVIIKPVKLIHPDQEYFYTKEWQKGEAEADEDIKKGNLSGPFNNIGDALKVLKN
ncbi:MAG TPA: AbrB/MazE/SpoVT family DNA-binding domain-containing protein [Ignavibacteria bacterium]|nr:AbrB/MazE/SpoVT family DNA-binding domain-containing protein [Ignavibacteria bacterium]